VDRHGVRDRRPSVSPGIRGSESPQKPPVVSRRPTGFGDREIPRETEDRRVGSDRDGKGSVGGKDGFGEKDERKTGAPLREAKDVGEKRLYSDLEDRRTGSDRAFREKKDKWAHSDLNDEEEDPQRGGVLGEKRLYSDLETRRTGFDRSVRDSREKWDHNDSNEGQKETTRAVTGAPGEKRPQSEIERNTGVGRDNLGDDRYYNDNGRRVDDRIGKDGGSGKRETDTRKPAVEKEDRYLSDRRDRYTGKRRSPLSERQQAVKDTRGVRKTVELSQSPVRERREDYERRPMELDNDDSDTVRKNLSKKSRIQEAEDGGAVREDDEGSLSPRGSEEKRKEEKRRRKEEKRLRREERHKRKREEKQKRKEEKRAMKAGTMNGEDKRDSPEGMEHSDDEHSEYDQKQLEDALRHKALESLLAKKAVSH